ncbi:tetratricopeptide repeat protein 19, mitochondrial-like isoform X2 [Hypanus sabinus]|uniref:tetratricopeptide repeat protein 19, mitochondrial-like isoform X2 n=1 Tax=Hypanus sabinus TaxID=79690 RepID=UPI0028C4E87B|nr:tetratricopeptide repeat protein 19, mitochondrial-like isoform X2 [Hypanus sabinus]
MLRMVASRGLRSGCWFRIRASGRSSRPPLRPASGLQSSLARPDVQSRKGSLGSRSGTSLALLATISIFQWGEKQLASEDEIILLIKHAKLSTAKGDLKDAERILHQALHLAQQAQNNQAISYIYCQMSNLAFLRGDLLSAERLFKATMSQLLGSGMQQDDNSLIEISLKLCNIYATTDRHHLAVEGYKWCIETLEEKVQHEEAVPEEALSEERENTRLLLAMAQDSCARYLLSQGQLELAITMYQKALTIAQDVHGETHPQAVVLLSDLATVLDMKGCYDQAYEYISRASSLARETGHTDEHRILSNMARILVHAGNYTEARKVYEEALKQAKLKGDELVIQHIQEGMEELDTSTHSSHGEGQAKHQ